LTRRWHARATAGARRGTEGATAGAIGHRHGSRTRTLMGTFGKTEIAVPRAPLATAGGKTMEWKSHVLGRYQRRTQPIALRR
jgi:hypothetical protein